jgi:hypothetical protein
VSSSAIGRYKPSYPAPPESVPRSGTLRRLECHSDSKHCRRVAETLRMSSVAEMACRRKTLYDAILAGLRIPGRHDSAGSASAMNE